jgi:hypothetical protein
MKRAFLIALIMGATGSVAIDSAQAQTRVMMGRPTSTTITHRDFSREVITPDGRHTFYNANGTPRGINTTCSSTGLLVHCSNWGPNSYGPR